MNSLTDQTTLSHSWQPASTGQARGAAPVLVTLTILGHPDPARIGEIAVLGETAAGRSANLSRLLPTFSHVGEAGTAGRPLADRFLSRQPILLHPATRASSGESGGCRLVCPSSATRARVDGEPFEGEMELSPSRLDAGVVLNLADRVILLLHRRAPPQPPLPPRLGLVGDSASLLRVRRTIARVAQLDVSVLLTGATGTGKELVARALHEASDRRGDFVAVNVATLSSTLAASELFGARKGAFTGAVREQEGLFVAADGGTLFLDEIGEAPPEVQAMLLRVLETSEVVPVGGQKPKRVDVRVVAATDADLDRLIADERFKAPLLHRLGGYRILLPSLGQRRDDLGRLLVAFLHQECQGVLPEGTPAHPWLPARLVEQLTLAAWPGNVRQLRNVVRQLVIESTDQPTLQLSAELKSRLTPAASTSSTSPPMQTEHGPTRGAGSGRRRRLAAVSDEEVATALREHDWELKATAEALGVARTSLYSRLQRSSRFRLPADLEPDEIQQAFERQGGDLLTTARALEVSATALRQRLAVLGLEPAEVASNDTPSNDTPSNDTAPNDTAPSDVVPNDAVDGPNA